MTPMIPIMIIICEEEIQVMLRHEKKPKNSQKKESFKRKENLFFKSSPV